MSEEKHSRYELYREAKSHESSGRYDDALKAYGKAIEISSDYAHAWYYKSKLHYKLHQYDEAKYCAEKALKIAPTWEKHIQKILDDCNYQSRS